MGEIRFQGEGDMIHNHDFINKFLNPALNNLSNMTNLSDIQLYHERASYFGDDAINLELKAEKTNMPIKRVDLKALVNKLTDEASKIVQIDGEFYDLEEKIDDDKKWIIAQNYKPIFRIDFGLTAHSQRFNMADYNKETVLKHYLDHMDSHHGKPWHVSMEFKGPDEFIRGLYENLLDLYKTSEKTNILV
jgi:hypothetical protein